MNLRGGCRRIASLLMAAGLAHWLLLAGSAGYAGSTNSVQSPTLPDQAKGGKKPKISARPVIIGAIPSTSDSSKPARPGGGTSTETQAVNQLINQLQTARQTYLASQKDLRLRLATSTEDQRVLIREEVKESLAKWKEEQAQFVAEQKERMKLIKLELHPDLGRVVDVSGEGSTGGRGR